MSLSRSYTNAHINTKQDGTTAHGRAVSRWQVCASSLSPVYGYLFARHRALRYMARALARAKKFFRAHSCPLHVMMFPDGQSCSPPQDPRDLEFRVLGPGFRVLVRGCLTATVIVKRRVL